MTTSKIIQRIPLLDLKTQYISLREEIDDAISHVLKEGQFVLGANVDAFEQEMADYLGVRHAIGVASGTDALVIALRALEIGVGDEVIVPSYTFFATAEAVLQVGAIPVLVDIDPATYCMDVGQIEASITARTAAIIPVHLYGHPAAMTPLMSIARQHGLRVIEDNAQAIGARYRGRRTGSIGDAGCLSFFPSKNLGAFGDAGMLVTNTDRVAEHARMLRAHGWSHKYFPEMVGYNSRLDEIQAAILRVKLPHLDAWNDKRRNIADRYRSRLADAGAGLPPEAPDVSHAYHLFVIRVPHRQRIQQFLREEGIASNVYYPKALHELGPCSDAVRTATLVESERASTEALAIPLYPEMDDEAVDQVAEAVIRALDEAS